MLRKTLVENAWFFVPFLVLQLAGLYIVPFEDKFEFFLRLNGVNSPIADWVFLVLTRFVEWYGWVVTALIALLIRVRFVVFAVFGMIISGISSQFLKHFVFHSNKRPSHFFSNDQMNVVEGVNLHSSFSFPSGHTTAAFSIFLILTLLLNRKWKWLGGVFFILATAIGYSRIYLSQHFPEDVLAGSVLGTIATLMVYLVNEWFFGRTALDWAEKSFFGLFTRLG